MTLTVRECLAIDAWKNVKVIAGKEGLDRKVTFVNIMEVPEVVRWMKGGELLLTAGYAFKDDQVLQKKLVDDLVKKDIAGLGIKPGQYLTEIPRVIVDHANSRGFPILELPKELPYMELMLPVFEIMISHQLYQLKRAEEIHNRLLGVVLEGDGFTELCQSLAELVGNPVLILDKSGVCLASCPEPDLTCDYVLSDLLTNLEASREGYAELGVNRWNSVELSLGEKTQSAVLVPIGLNDGIAGFLMVVECNKEMDEHDTRAVEYAGTIAALVFAKEKAVFEAERQIKGELLEDLISCNYQSEEIIIKRANFLNFNIKNPLAVFVLDIDSFEQYFIDEASQNEEHVQELKKQVFEFCHHAFRGYPGGAMLQIKSDGIIGLVRVGNRQDEVLLKEKCVQVCQNVRIEHPKVTVSIGIGNVYSKLQDIKKSYEEALAALGIGRLMKGGDSITLFRDLGAYRFLYELKDSHAARQFYLELVGKVVKYDAHNKSELLMTLQRYFANNCNARLTAEELFIHKNSVIYRIKKIEELTGLDFGNPGDRFNFQLCLKLHQIWKSQVAKGPRNLLKGFQ